MTQITQQMINRLARIPIKTTEYLSWGEKQDGTEQMLRDLESLAARDGCIAAGWALEILETVGFKNP